MPRVLKYNNGRTAIEYQSMGIGSEYEDGGVELWPESECIATINIPDEPLDNDEVIIKTYSENEGIYDLMVAAGHIGPEIRRVSNGFITAPVCKCLIL